MCSSDLMDIGKPTKSNQDFPDVVILPISIPFTCNSMLSYKMIQEGYKVLKSLSDACKESLWKDLQGGKAILVAGSDWLDRDANVCPF